MLKKLLNAIMYLFLLLVLVSKRQQVNGQCYQTLYPAGEPIQPTGGSFWSPTCSANYTLSTLSGSTCYPTCDAKHDPYGPLCYLKSCRGAYNYSCNLPLVCSQLILIPGIGPIASFICSSHGLICTKHRTQCSLLNEKFGTASIIIMRNMAALIATQGN